MQEDSGQNRMPFYSDRIEPYRKNQYGRFVFPALCVLGFLFFSPSIADAARLIISPTSATFEVGSTFTVSILLDTEGESINAFDVVLKFPPDKLQVVSPSVGKSITEIWTGPPQYNNRTGIVRLKGGITNGITVSQGLITELIFRVRQVGTGILSFGESTTVLLNDGKGTEALSDTTRGVYHFVLPPPAGPTVASETHPDQTLWHSRSDVIFRWGNEGTGIAGYSYMISKDPIDVPDNISEGGRTNVTYSDLSDGTQYFHIKSLRGDVWGGVTHFAINVDTEPPAEFPVTISPSAYTTNTKPIVLFESTDVHSGMDYYEMKVISLSPTQTSDEIFFIEVQSRQILELEYGRYDIVIRAHDQAGNIREVVKRVTIVGSLFRVIPGGGLQIGTFPTIPWSISSLSVIFIIGALTYVARRSRKWHVTYRNRSGKHAIKEEMKGKLDELKKYRGKYTKVVIALILFTSVLFRVDTVFAQSEQSLPPPIITTVSKNISNEDIFYVGGKAGNTGGEVVLYLQNMQTGEVFNWMVLVEERNEWFYRHDSFLTSGDYTIWAQQRLGDQISAPSPQQNLQVRTTAIQFGSSRFSLETLYLIIAIILLIVIISLLGYILFHVYHGRKWRKRFLKEVHEAEEALRHGFMVLRRDIQAELGIVKQMKLKGALAQEEERREAQLLEDLDSIEKNIGREIMDIEELERE